MLLFSLYRLLRERARALFRRRPASTEPPPERRGAPRLVCHQPCLVRFDRRFLDGRAGDVRAEGTVIDLSSCGVGLLLKSAVPPGGTLAVGPFNSGTTLPTASVVRCVPLAGRWRHGCRLERRLNEEELAAWLA